MKNPSNETVAADLSENGTDEPCNQRAATEIAIVGMGMRLPGSVRTAEQFWDLLISKRDCSSDVPPSRYNIDAFYDPEKPQSVRTRRGYFLDDDCLRKTDESFFSKIAGFAMNELDPQQRLLMEVVWECMENAGQTEWQGSDIGCYVGVFGEDWHESTAKETQSISRVHAFANGGFTLSNRVSYEFDLKGPSMTISTACSSSLVALHEACQAIDNGTCHSAIVAGTNMLLTPAMSVTMSENMVLSQDGHCKVFDASADGYGRGEAVNAVYLKPLNQAIADGDNVRAVIRATSANYDGRSARIFAPDIKSQENLIRQAYSRAQIHDISQTAFVECHGTGTKVGDVVETTAIARVFGKKGVHIGSAKSNVGHGEGASGLTGLIKAVIALEHRVIPPNMHFSHPNPRIPFKEGGLKVPIEPISWPQDRKQRASVNCFGIGGSNAHAILESFDATQKPGGVSFRPLRPQIVVASARSDAALDMRTRDIKAYITNRPNSLKDIAYTLGARRVHLSHRAYLLCDSTGSVVEEAYQTARASDLPVSVVFTFTGQGAQWPGMGKELLHAFPLFHRDVHCMDEMLQELDSPPQWSIEAELRKSHMSNVIDELEYSQTLCAAIQIALVNLFASWGIHPSATLGYSSGEIVAAYAARAINMRTAITLAYNRGICVKSAPRSGGMAVVGLERNAVTNFLLEGVTISGENSPQSVCISGEKSKLTAVTRKIQEERPDTFVRHLPIEVAYHSPDMKVVGLSFEASIASHISHKSTMIPMYSTTLGTKVSDPAKLDAAYWRKNLESPVLFSSAIQTLLSEQKETANLFVEIGTHSTLSSPLRQIFALDSPATQNFYTPTLLKDKSQTICLLKTVGSIYLHGCPVDFAKISGTGNVLVDLPAYPWDRQNIDWKESRISRNWRFRQHPHHELLGSRVLEGTSLEPSWRNLLNTKNVLWLNDHRVCGEVTFPCAGYIAMINEAMSQLENTNVCTIRNLYMKVPLILSANPSDMVELVTTMRPMRINDRLDSKWYEFSISSFDGSEWIKHTVGEVIHLAEGLDTSAPELQQFSRPVSSEFWYEMLAKLGLEYGPRFRGLEAITADPVSFRANASLNGDPDGSGKKAPVHPTVIDECLQLFSVAACNGRSIHLTKLYIPMYIREICIGRGRSKMVAEAHGTSYEGSQGRGNVILAADGEKVLSMHDVTFVQLDYTNEKDTSGIPLLSYAEWRPDIDFLPGHLQLSNHAKKQDEVLLFSRACMLSMILTYRDVSKKASYPEPLERYTQWLEQQIKVLEGKGLEEIPEAQRWAQQEIEELQLAWENLEQSLKAKQLSFISDFARMRAKNIRASFEKPLCKETDEQNHEAEKMFADWTVSLGNLSEWFTLLRHSNPALRILEIGPNNGALTSNILSWLVSGEQKLYSQYTWTEMGQVGSDVQERLGGYKAMRFQSLDITKDPLQQGVQENSFDLVIASYVNDWRSCMLPVLKNIKSLLSPGGRLFIHEYCPGESILEFVMVFATALIDTVGGLPMFDHLLSGFSSPPSTVHQERLSTELWNNNLKEAGFLGVEAAGYDGEAPYHLHRTIISRVLPKDHAQNGLIYLLCPNQGGHSPWVDEAQQTLIQNGYTVQRFTIGKSIPQKQHVISLIDLAGPFFHNISEENWKWFQEFLNTTPQILWLTKSVELGCPDPDFSIVMGVSRTARQEQELHFGTFQVDNFDTPAIEGLLKICSKFFNPAESNGLTDADYEFSLHEGLIHIPRMHWTSMSNQLTLSPTAEQSAVKLTIDSYGLIDSLYWTDYQPPSLGQDEVEVDIKFVGLNFRDIMITLGVMAHKDELGMEASGVVRRCGRTVKDLQPGDKLMVCKPGLFRTRAIVPRDRCNRSPDSLSFEDAASMPVVYSTAYYCLIEIGRLEKGQSILIHAACGGVGLAAIQLSQMVGANIYATVGSETKVEYLVNNFDIPRSHIFSSRDASFHRNLMAATNGQGVDVVLNSLAGELLHASWKCVAEFGKMIEIGKRDFMEHGTLGLEAFGGNRAFFGVDLIRLVEKPGQFARLARKVVDLYEEGKISPIRPQRVLSSIDTLEAFRCLQRGLHMGKLLVEMPEPKLFKSDLVTKSRHQLRLSPDLSYILVGGLGGVGRAIAAWMVERGARNLVFFSRSAGNSHQDQSFARELEAQGCNVVLVKGDVTLMEDVQTMIHDSPSPVGGILQLSMIVRDQFIPDMSHKNWEDVLSAKVTGTWNLHHALTGCDDHLQYFVVCGSITGVMGNAGQVNYSSGNAFVSSFAQYRLEKGLPASVVNLGGVDDVGFLATQDLKLRERMRSAAVRLLSEQEVLDAFELAMIYSRPSNPAKCPEGSLRVPNNFIVGMSSTKSLADPSARPLWGQDARFRNYASLDTEQKPAENALQGASRLRQLLVLAENNSTYLNDPDQVERIVMEIVRTIQEYSIFARGQSYTEVAAMPIDSLMTVEIRNWARRFLDLELSLIGINKAATIEGLAGLIVDTLRSKYLST